MYSSMIGLMNLHVKYVELSLRLTMNDSTSPNTLMSLTLLMDSPRQNEEQKPVKSSTEWACLPRAIQAYANRHAVANLSCKSGSRLLISPILTAPLLHSSLFTSSSIMILASSVWLFGRPLEPVHSFHKMLQHRGSLHSSQAESKLSRNPKI